MVIPTPVSLLYTCTEAIKTMNLNLRWPASHSASCFHTIHAWLRWRRLANGRLADAIAPAAEELARQVAATGVSAEQFWSHLIALAAEIDGNRELAETAVRKTLHMGSCPMLQLPRWSARFPTLRPLSTQPRPIFWISSNCAAGR